MPPASRLSRIAPYALVGGACIYLYQVASGIQYHAREGVLGPEVWPKAMLAFVIALCAIQIVLALLPGPRRGEEGFVGELMEEAGSGEAGADRSQGRPWTLLGGMALSALYVWAVTLLGFVAATVPYLLVFIRLGGYRRWGVIAAVSVIGTLVLFFFFVRVVYVSLPIGQEPFAQVTLALMKLLGVR